jgi:hypothetical protein
MANIANAGANFFSGGGSGSSEVTPAEIASSISALGGAVPGVELGAEENGNNGINAPPVIMNYCDGEWVKSSSGKYLPVRDPSTGLVSCQVFRSNAADVDAAVDAADRAKTGWANTSTTKRAELLERVAVMLRERAEDLAKCESCDAGKPVRLARIIDIPRAAENFEFFARMLRTDSTASHAMDDAINITQRCPVGVAGKSISHRYSDGFEFDETV